MSINRIIQQAAAGGAGGGPEFKEGVTQIGDAVDGGFFAGIIDTTQSNIIAADDYQTGARYALIVSPKDYEGGFGSSPAAGLPTGALVWDSADRTGQSGSFTRWDGLSSTDSILAKNDSQYEVFEFIRDLRSEYPVPDDGGSDWYLPAMDELELLYRNLKPVNANNYIDVDFSYMFPPTAQDQGYNPSSDPVGSAYTSSVPSQTSVTIFQSGGDEAIDLARYWSSTDANTADSRAWRQDFNVSGVEGRQAGQPKDNVAGGMVLRPVRRILL
jgi:hypothetical protein